jgi:hypothetical protein
MEKWKNNGRYIIHLKLVKVKPQGPAIYANEQNKRVLEMNKYKIVRWPIK